MDNRGKAAALVGLSAIGGILAYYGISQYGNEKEEPVEVETIDKETSVNNDKKEESVADTVGSYLTNLVTGNKNIKLSIDETDSDKEQSKEASTEVTSEESTKPVGNEDNKAKWSKYWSNEYDKQQNNNDKSEEEASAADFN
tara:strand:- start:1204 stop:1629 length:426 start_codon:yes stop_codon:yes gene_type:complete